jgi:ABC-type lipoprotein release transport system permease subunit
MVAAAAGRLIASFLLCVAPVDPVVFGSAAGLCVARGVVACLVPAHRASAIDAMEALRYE